MIDLSRDADRRADAILVLTLVLMAIGLVMVASTSVTLDRTLFEPGMWRTPFGRQLVFAGAGLVILFGSAKLAPAVLASPLWRSRFAWAALALAVLLLAAAYVPGLADPRRGSHRWLRIPSGGFELAFQPSELAKPAMVAALAALLAGAASQPRSFFRGFLPGVAVVGVCVGLVGKADFGTCAVVGVVGGMMLVAAGCRIPHIVLLVLGGAAGMYRLITAEQYRMERITAFLALEQDPQGKAYQPLQSLGTVASGGWFGRGLGSGLQKHGYLPESHTDFIFSVVCEETGVLGAVVVIALFCGVLWLGFRAMLRARSPFERLMAMGLTGLIVCQAGLNLAVATVLTPTTGVSLPFISAGGSGLLTSCLAMGLLSAIARRGHGLEESAPVSPDAFAGCRTLVVG